MGDSYNEMSKKRLMNNLQKKFNTVAVGALVAFEETMGELWGHGLPYEKLTEEQKEYRKKWEQIRTKVLDLGGTNCRAAKSEIAQYSLRWNRYVMNFKVEE